MKQPIDLKNIDRETQILYAGVVTFGSQTAYDLTGIKLSDNEAFGRLFTSHLLRRIVRDIVQTPEKSTDIEIALFPAGLHYSWNIGDEKFEITSHDTNAIPNTISISYDNLLLTHPVGAVKTKSTVRGITLAHQPYTDRAQWRKYRGGRNMMPYMVLSQIAEYINLNADTEVPLINFQSVETMCLIDIQKDQFTVAFDVLGRLYTLVVDTL